MTKQLLSLCSVADDDKQKRRAMLASFFVPFAFFALLAEGGVFPSIRRPVAVRRGLQILILLAGREAGAVLGYMG